MKPRTDHALFIGVAAGVGAFELLSAILPLVMPTNLVFYVVICGGAIAGGVAVDLVVRAAGQPSKQRAATTCARCGSELAGSTSGRCSACGQKIAPPADATGHSASANRRTDRALFVGVATGFATLFLLRFLPAILPFVAKSVLLFRATVWIVALAAGIAAAVYTRRLDEGKQRLADGRCPACNCRLPDRADRCPGCGEAITPVR